MQRIASSEDEEISGIHIESAADYDSDDGDQLLNSLDHQTEHAVEHYHDDESGSDDSRSDLEEEMGQVARQQKRRLQSMGIMLGDDFLDNDNNSCCGGGASGKHWYVWLCCSVVLVSVLLALDGAFQYSKQVAFLHGSGENGDDYDEALCRIYDKKTLQIVENHLANANDTKTFCQEDVSTGIGSVGTYIGVICAHLFGSSSMLYYVEIGRMHLQAPLSCR